jgi:hypothetical protein
MCRRRTPSKPWRSARVRATRKVRCQARAERPSRSAPRASRARPSGLGSAMAARWRRRYRRCSAAWTNCARDRPAGRPPARPRSPAACPCDRARPGAHAGRRAPRRRAGRWRPSLRRAAATPGRRRLRAARRCKGRCGRAMEPRACPDSPPRSAARPQARLASIRWPQRQGSGALLSSDAAHP